MKPNYVVSFWVEEKSYDERPSREWYDDRRVYAASELDAEIAVKAMQPTGQHWYGFEVVPYNYHGVQS